MLTAGDCVPRGDRIYWIDAAKGFAAMLVVLGHNILGFLDEGRILSQGALWRRAVDWIYSFHMFLFFFLSGWLFFRAFFGGRAGDRAKRKFWIRFGDLLAVYLVYSVLFWASRFVLSDHVRIQVDWTDLIRIPFVPLEMYWFLWVLICLYFAGFLVLTFSENRRGFGGLPWLVSSFVIGFASAFLPGRWGFGILGVAAFYAPAFFAGAYGCKNGMGFLRKRPVYTGILLLSAAVTAGIFCAGWRISTVPLVNTLCALLLSVAFIGLFQRLEHGKSARYSVTAMVGRHALEIYLLQHYAIAVARRLVTRLALPVNAPVLVFSTAAEIAVPVLAGMLLKKLRLHTLAFRPVTWFLERWDRKTEACASTPTGKD